MHISVAAEQDQPQSISAATASVDITLRAILDPDRAARLVAQHSVDSKNISFGEVTKTLEKTTLAVGESSMEGALLRVVRTAVVRQLIGLASNASAEPQVRAVAEGSLRRISRALSVPKGDGVEFDHRGYTERTIRRFLDRSGAEDVPQRPLPTPAGPPIG